MDGVSYRSTGVCFQQLNVHGYGEATGYQKDVASVWLSLSSVARRVTGGGRQRIDILRDFNGLVRNGEMLAVLGPPDSSCSTFPKTTAGEMSGIYVDNASYFNYQVSQGLTSCLFAIRRSSIV
jgi:ATP-binding cassette subfamily G (WHITE) protein 2 (PDR)